MPQPRRVLFLQRSFSPEMTASGEMLRQLAEFLAERNWEPHIVCAIPASAETLPGLRIHRTPAIPYRRGSRIARVISMWRSGRAMESVARRCPKPDVVVSLTDPPGLVLMGDRVARHHGAPHVHWSQDVYPEIATRLGVVSAANPYIRYLRAASTRAMLRAHAVISIGRCMTRVLSERGVPADKLVTIPNWANPAIATDAGGTFARKDLGLPEYGHIALYSGNLGMAHEFETVLECAALLDAQNADWQFVFAGSGARKGALEEASRARGLRNMRFLPHLEDSDYRALSCAADLHLVTLDARIAGCMVPSKFYAALACGSAVACVGPPDSEVAEVLKATNAGVLAQNGDPAALAALLRGLSENPSTLLEKKRCALAASREFSLEAGGGGILEVLERSL